MRYALSRWASGSANQGTGGVLSKGIYSLECVGASKGSTRGSPALSRFAAARLVLLSPLRRAAPSRGSPPPPRPARCPLGAPRARPPPPAARRHRAPRRVGVWFGGASYAGGKRMHYIYNHVRIVLKFHEVSVRSSVRSVSGAARLRRRGARGNPVASRRVYESSLRGMDRSRARKPPFADAPLRGDHRLRARDWRGVCWRAALAAWLGWRRGSART